MIFGTLKLKYLDLITSGVEHLMKNDIQQAESNIKMWEMLMKITDSQREILEKLKHLHVAPK